MDTVAEQKSKIQITWDRLNAWNRDMQYFEPKFAGNQWGLTWRAKQWNAFQRYLKMKEPTLKELGMLIQDLNTGA